MAGAGWNFGSPTGAELLADITAYAILSLKHQPEISGLYHLVASGYTSWYDFARFILEHAKHVNFPLKIQSEALLPIASIGFPLPAIRPLNSRLSTCKIQKTFEVNLPAWQIGVSRTLTEILGK